VDGRKSARARPGSVTTTDAGAHDEFVTVPRFAAGGFQVLARRRTQRPVRWPWGQQFASRYTLTNTGAFAQGQHGATPGMEEAGRHFRRVAEAPPSRLGHLVNATGTATNPDPQQLYRAMTETMSRELDITYTRQNRSAPPLLLQNPDWMRIRPESGE
jgi:hypothetical protein